MMVNSNVTICMDMAGRYVDMILLDLGRKYYRLDYFRVQLAKL
jgi:hypothetical protein